jgi:hypothetical protein
MSAQSGEKKNRLKKCHEESSQMILSEEARHKAHAAGSTLGSSTIGRRMSLQWQVEDGRAQVDMSKGFRSTRMLSGVMRTF